METACCRGEDADDATYEKKLKHGEDKDIPCSHHFASLMTIMEGHEGWLQTFDHWILNRIICLLMLKTILHCYTCVQSLQSGAGTDPAI